MINNMRDILKEIRDSVVIHGVTLSRKEVEDAIGLLEGSIYENIEASDFETVVIDGENLNAFLVLLLLNDRCFVGMVDGIAINFYDKTDAENRMLFLRDVDDYGIFSYAGKTEDDVLSSAFSIDTIIKFFQNGIYEDVKANTRTIKKENAIIDYSFMAVTSRF